MGFYYGEIKERLKLQKLLKRLENRKILTDEQVKFVEEKLNEPKNRKLWLGVNFRKNGLQRLQIITKEINEEKSVES